MKYVLCIKSSTEEEWSTRVEGMNNGSGSKMMRDANDINRGQKCGMRSRSITYGTLVYTDCLRSRRTNSSHYISIPINKITL